MASNTSNHFKPDATKAASESRLNATANNFNGRGITWSAAYYIIEHDPVHAYDTSLNNYALMVNAAKSYVDLLCATTIELDAPFGTNGTLIYKKSSDYGRHPYIAGFDDEDIKKFIHEDDIKDGIVNRKVVEMIVEQSK